MKSDRVSKIFLVSVIFFIVLFFLTGCSSKRCLQWGDYYKQNIYDYRKDGSSYLLNSYLTRDCIEYELSADEIKKQAEKKERERIKEEERERIKKEKHERFIIVKREKLRLEKERAFKEKKYMTDGRFIAYENGTVLDTKTNLMWAAENGDYANWKDAKSYCENYRRGGYTDWRMPTYDELEGLYDKNKPRLPACHYKYYIRVATELIDITCFGIWASETRGSDAAFIDFEKAGIQWKGQSSDIRALPVRSGK